MMLPILGLVLALEIGLAFLLISKVPPLEKLACLIMDLTHTTKGSAVTRTLAGTLLIFLASSVTTYVKTQSFFYSEHQGEHAHIGPGEIYVLRTAELESAVTCFILLLALMINRTHYYLRGKRGLTVQLDILKKQSKSAQAEYLRLQEEKNESSGKNELVEEVKSLKDVIEDLREKVEKLQKELQAKEKELKAAENSAQAIRKQSEGMALEYQRLMEDNESLRVQVSSFDHEHSRSSSKKDT